MSKVGRKYIYYVPDILELLPIREYRCEFECGKVFKNRIPYELHLQKKHGVEIQENEFEYYRCPVDNCEYFGGRLNLVRRHYQSNHMDKKFNCDVCSRKFLTESQRSKHRCELPTYSCHLCPRTFQLLSARNRHVKLCVKKARPSTPDLNDSADQSLENDQTENSKPSADASLIEISNSEADDNITIEEFEQLLQNIENNIVKDTALIEELAALTPVLESLQS